MLLQGPGGGAIFANERLGELTGLDAGALLGLGADAFHALLSRQLGDGPDYLAALPQSLEGGFALDRVVEVARPERRVLRWTARPVHSGDVTYQLNLWEDLTAEVDLQAQRARLAVLDPLTEMLNRRGIEEELEREAARSERKGHIYTILRVRLHNIEEINRLGGHADGDEALRTVARCLQQSLRQPDRAARWSGRNFLVLLPETPLAGARGVAARIRDAVTSLEVSFPLDLSIGLADSQEQGGLEPCLAAAELRLQEARRSGAGSIV